jgi:hypothetical protein
MECCSVGDGKTAAGGSVDIAHISFLDMIKVMITMSGAANAKGTLIRNALNTAEKIQSVEYGNFDEFLAAMEDHSNPITMVEGKAVHVGDFVFGLPACPFAASIRNYTRILGTLPESYADFTVEFNKSTQVTRKYRVGEGAGVSPFCAVHQPLRSALGDKIKIGGKNVAIYQLGCKSGSGKKGLAPSWIEETGVSSELVEKILDTNMCCYYVKIVD